MPKVQCLADCMPGGKTYQMSFCGAHQPEDKRSSLQPQPVYDSLDDLVVPAANDALNAPWPDESCLGPGDNVDAYFKMALARGPSPVNTTAWSERGSLKDIMVVINAADNRASVPREMLLQSLANAKFGPWERVVMVLGGAEIDEKPRLTPVTEVVSGSVNVSTWEHGRIPRIVVIRTTLMNYDLR